MKLLRNIGVWLAGCLILLLVTAGCASSGNNQGQDPAAVKVELSTEPTPVAVGQKIRLQAAITGLNHTDGAEVQFDIREPDAAALPALVNAALAKDGFYEADYTFKAPGSYKVYVHLYQDDLHITKKSQLVVKK